MSTGESKKLRGIPILRTVQVWRGQAEVESTVIHRGGSTVKTPRPEKGGGRARWGDAFPPQTGARQTRKGEGWQRTKMITNTDIWLRAKQAGNCPSAVQMFTRQLMLNMKKILKVGKTWKVPVTDTITRSLCTGNDMKMIFLLHRLDITTTGTIVQGPGTMHVRGRSTRTTLWRSVTTETIRCHFKDFCSSPIWSQQLFLHINLNWIDKLHHEDPST